MRKSVQPELALKTVGGSPEANARAISCCRKSAGSWRPGVAAVERALLACTRRQQRAILAGPVFYAIMRPILCGDTGLM